MARRGRRTKTVRKALAAVVFAVLGRGLVAAARLDASVRGEVRSWPAGTVVTLRIAPWGPQVSWRRTEDAIEHLGGRDVQKPSLLVTFKSVDHAIPLLLGLKPVLRAFAEHRATVAGDLALAMSFVRCLHAVEGYLFPDFMTKRILPRPAERESSYLAAYAALVFRAARIGGDAT